VGILGSLEHTRTLAQIAAAVERRHYSADTHSTKYSPAAQIDKNNVRSLRVVWRWTSAGNHLKLDPPIEGQRYSDTPLMVKDTLYTVTSLGQIAALDPATGQTRWVVDPVSYRAGRPVNVGYIHRGLAYWTDSAAERLLLGTHDAYLISVDAKTGTLDTKLGTDGKVDLTVGIRNAVRALNFTANSAPLIAGDVAVVGGTINDFPPNKEDVPGDIRGFDVRTGKLLWTFHTIPRRGEPGYETWLDGSTDYSGSANVWTTMSYDPELDYVYVPTGTSTNHRYGGHRPGNNLFAESIVCLEAKTGKRVWHFQAVHHGLWDYDFPAPLVLGDITVNGRRIKAVMQVSKQALTYVLDRKAGQPVWPFQECPAPESSMPSEHPSPTQPFPTKPPAFDLQGTVEDNLIDYTPELKKRAFEVLNKFEHGPMFTPASEKGTLFLPGMNGGARAVFCT
jgi:quinoprotein glucose dehydrogenase